MEPEDRRKYPRYDCSYRAVYKKVSFFSKEEEGSVSNVSRGGLKVTVKRLVQIGENVRLKIFNPYFDEPIETEARVVWVKKNDADNTGIMGLSFTHIGWTETERLLYGCR